MNRITKSVLLVVFFPILITAFFYILSQRAQPTGLPVYKDNPTTKSFIEYDKRYMLTGQKRCYPGIIMDPLEYHTSTHDYITINRLSSMFTESSRSGDSYKATIVFYMNVPLSENYSLWIPPYFCEYRLYCNGEMIGETVSFGDDNPSYPATSIYELPYSADGTYEIMMNIISPSIFSVESSDMLMFGTSEFLNDIFQSSIRTGFVFLSYLIFLIMFFTIQLIALRGGKSHVAFLIFAVTSLVSSGFSDDKVIMLILPHVPYQIGIILEGLSTPLMLISLVYLAYVMFPENFPKKLSIVFAIFQVVPLLNVLTFEQIKMLSTLSMMISTLPLAICLYVYIFAYERRESYATSYGIGILFVEISVLTRLLTSSLPVPARFLYSFGLTVFSLIEIIVLAKRYSAQQQEEVFYKNELQLQLEAMQASENAFLNAQMKPHFLYNTLNTIADLCVTEPPKAKRLILTLTEYLKLVLSLDNMDETVTLLREIELAENYAHIEQERFPSIKFFTSYPNKLPAIEMPPLTIQPLIENAIKHGVRKSDKPGIITFRIAESETDVTFYVSDNGLGMDEATIEKLFEIPKENKSIGIYNIDKRLKNKYGHGLTVESTPGLGTCVSFSIPKH